MKGNLFLNSDDQKFNFGLAFFGPPGSSRKRMKKCQHVVNANLKHITDK